ncbi:hypothetical protein BaRGS_00006293, partial [Batillaria attramentaria]
MPLKFLQGLKWPKAYGFEIFGKGPAYVVSVETGSVADKAGLKPGDQILELEGQDVTTMSAATIKTLARQSRNQPPALEVVACLAEVLIEPAPVSGYGFSVLNERPVVVGSVDFTGPAYEAGLRVGDVILEINHKHPEGVEAVGTVLTRRPGQLTMLTIPVGRTGNLVHVDKGLSQLPSSDPRVHRAKDLYDKLGDVLGDDYERKMAVVAILKQYAEDRDVDILCRSLDAVLKSPHERSILRHIRLLVSPHQRPVFDELLKSGQTRNSPAHSNKSQNQVTPATHIVGSKKVIQVVREDGSFGFVVKGCNPAFIESVDPGGPAEKAGLQDGDFIIKLNGLDVSLSESSHGSDLLPFEQNHADREGKTFTQNADYLLTSKEKSQLKRALQHYDLHRDVVGLYSSLEPVLDTPSKCMLWKFILIHLNAQHRDYVLHRVGLPTHLLLELVDGDKFGHLAALPAENAPIHEDLLTHTSTGHSSHQKPQSFEHHIDFLLTSRERMQFKTALHSYHENHDLQPLVEVMKLILDTTSKGILWRYVLPRLTPAHRGVVRQMLDMPDTHSVSGLSLSAMDSYIGSYDEGSQQVDTATNTEENVLYDENESSVGSDSLTGRHQVKLKSPSAGGVRGDGKGEDQAILQEVLATRRAVEEVKEAIRGKTEKEPPVDYDVDEDDPYHQDLESRHFVTIIPVGYPGFDLNRRPFVSKEMNSPEFSKFRKFVGEKRITRPSSLSQRSLQTDQREDDDNSSSSSESEDDTGFSVPTSPRHQMGDSLNANALVALKELDAVMDAEASDLENSPRHQPGRRTEGGKSGHNWTASATVPVPPAPPPPPPPGVNSTTVHVSETAMNVKRINWEKLDNKTVENTIWEQLCDGDLSEVIHYLELETQFSTKPARPTILLGHLKMTVSEIKQAIYLMDEETLTPELLRQLIAYAPSRQEMAHYDAYTGEIDELSKPDQFAYEVSQIHGYEQRLRGLLFKASFRERTEEMKESLRSIKLASNELRHSKKLARLLELILAMGNYMNKGNSRVGEAAGFRISFLTQLDITKTADSKSTFLHVLADTAYTKFPDLLSVGEELANVAEASKDEIQSVFRLQATAMEEFANMVAFFGEDPHEVSTSDIFSIFYDFVTKFE